MIGYANIACRDEVARHQALQCNALISNIEHAQNLDVPSARGILDVLAQGPWSDTEKQRLSGETGAANRATVGSRPKLGTV